MQFVTEKQQSWNFVMPNRFFLSNSSPLPEASLGLCNSEDQTKARWYKLSWGEDRKAPKATIITATSRLPNLGPWLSSIHGGQTITDMVRRWRREKKRKWHISSRPPFCFVIHSSCLILYMPLREFCQLKVGIQMFKIITIINDITMNTITQVKMFIQFTTFD